MAINRSDLAIFEPEQLGNGPNAGGQRTANRIVSGQLNNLFSPISDIDHARSAVQIAKCYPALDTAGTESLVGAHIFINRPPVDDKVSVILVESDLLTDDSKMEDMVNILESSVVMGGLAGSVVPGMIYGQDSLVIFSTVGSPLTIGRVYVLSVEYPGTEDGNWPRQQHYFKVLSGGGNRQIYDPTTNSLRDGTSYRIDPPIDFAAPAGNVVINGTPNCTKVRYARQSDAVKFHGVSNTIGTIAEGATTLPLESVTDNLIPTIQVVEPFGGIRPFFPAVDRAFIPTANPDNFARRSISRVANGTGLTWTFSGAGFNPSVSTKSRLNVTPLIVYTDISGVLRSDVEIVTFNATTVQVQLSGSPKVGSKIYCYYIDRNEYRNYTFLSTWTVGDTILQGSFIGTVLDTAASVLRNIYEVGGQLFFSDSNELMGSIDYTTGDITILDPNFVIQTDATYCLVYQTITAQKTMSFSVGVSSPKLDTFQLTGTTTGALTLSASADSAGVISGAGVSGTINEYGEVQITFTNNVYRGSVSIEIQGMFQAIAPDDFYNFNVLRIPNDGLINIFNPFGVVSIQHANYQQVTGPAPGQVKTIRTEPRFVDITDADGLSLWTPTDDHYTVDREAGTVTINSAFPGFTAPFILVDVIGELALTTVVDAQTNNIEIADGLTREYPVGSTVSSVQELGDLQAQVGEVWDMSSWSGDWGEIGTPATANLNIAAFPIEVNNKGTINEDWAIIFTGSTSFRVVGKGVGQVASGDTLNDLIVTNSKVLAPYFIIRQGAFGAGWNQGEVIRFATTSAGAPIMPVRIVSPGHSQITTDRATLGFRGNEA